MFSGKKNIYFILLAGCVAGYIWLFLNLYTGLSQTHQTSICILKHATGIPCPSCGSTRSIVAILQGHFSEALQWNPLGFLLFLILILSPIWILFDIVTKKESLLRFYIRTEIKFKQKKIAIPAIALLMLNWYWNICKGL